MGVDYGWEKFFSALRYAVSSTDALQERLAGVISELSLLERDNFPDDEAWKRFQKMRHETTKHAAQGNEGNIRATTSQMSNDEAGKWLQEVLGLFSTITEAYGAENT